MQRLGITDSHYMRTRGAARTGAAPRDLDPAVNPQLTVDATHGRGSESIAGPQHDQHHPLQRTTARPSAHSASLNASPASPVARDGSHSARSSRTALNSQRLTPNQLAFVEQVENRLRLKADAASHNPSGSGDAGAHPLISDESNKLESPHESAGPSQQQPPIEGWPRDELEELRSQVAERDAQLAAMREKLSTASPEPLAPAEPRGGYELSVYQLGSKGMSLETGKQGFPHPAPPSGQRPIQPSTVVQPRFGWATPDVRPMGPRGLSPQPGPLHENEHPQRGERAHLRTIKPLTGEEVKANRIKLSPEKIAPWWQMLRAFLIARVPEFRIVLSCG